MSAASPALDVVEDRKLRGNEAFKDGHFLLAVTLYTEALDAARELNDVSLENTMAVLLANRAACHLKLENFGSAIADSTEAIKLDPDYLKGFYRRGSANIALSHFKEAKQDFLYVCKQKPTDRDARAKLAECEKQIKRILFEEAIAFEHERSAFAKIDPESIAVPDSYTGPRMVDGNITPEFVAALVEEFKAQRLVHKRYVVEMLVKLKPIFASTPSLVTVEIPEVFPSGERGKITVCGDTHGQYYDTLNIFAINGFPSPDNPYLFNGDFVDRGSFSVENVLTLFAYKLLYPDSVFLSRGNHETKNMNKMYGFEGEVKAKYDQAVMDLFTELFNDLPLCAVINHKVFVTHGGLFCKDGVKLSDLVTIPRGREPPDSGLMSDLLWSDPQPFPGRSPSKRGVGMSFGPDVTARFLEENGLELVIRSHEVKDEGYLVEHGGKCVTVFSAPNYCDQMGNKGAFVRLPFNMKPEYVQFTAVPHPPVKCMQYAGNMMSMFGL